ncbi:DUF6624 domain-containing protein [Chitinophaga nivalis]|uniref:DUF4919 domain-containing protein n=1 Tax=Chitinophaga nivalis TaxID=2991709 RepID=A0ABT3IND9_9BACT|nr:DUF6624 domain-containing protein [Chitinophaga nivalis]MCW3464834.1 hypothetical protein [Chitinophaga nivalis]MCW3485475.1 hypothetical protein [Chitinophaga nivalis]
MQQFIKCFFFAGLLLVYQYISAQSPGLSSAEKDSLIGLLLTADKADQQYRSNLEAIQQKYGSDAPEMKKLLQQMAAADAINQLTVTNILDKYGWLGPAVIGQQGNRTLFMVIQHARLPIQDKYLPMLRDAVDKGHASASQLALLEDRVALYHGKRQRYGSQVIWNMRTNQYQLAPMEDPDHADARRLAAGLPPLREYLSAYGMTWDVEQFKKELPANEAVFFKRNGE